MESTVYKDTNNTPQSSNVTNRKKLFSLLSETKRENLDYLKELKEHKNQNKTKDSSSVDSNDTLSIKNAFAVLLETLKGIKKSINEYNDSKEFINKQLKMHENRQKQELQSDINNELKTNQAHKKELDKLESKMKNPSKINKTSQIDSIKNPLNLQRKHRR